MGTLVKRKHSFCPFIWVALEQELCLPSRSEIIGLPSIRRLSNKRVSPLMNMQCNAYYSFWSLQAVQGWYLAPVSCTKSDSWTSCKDRWAAKRLPSCIVSWPVEDTAIVKGQAKHILGCLSHPLCKRWVREGWPELHTLHCEPMSVCNVHAHWCQIDCHHLHCPDQRQSMYC